MYVNKELVFEWHGNHGAKFRVEFGEF